MKKQFLLILSRIFAAVFIAVCAAPFLYVIYSSIWADGAVPFLRYYDVFWSTPAYLTQFWRSLAMSLLICAGQLLVSIFAAFAFAKFRFPGREPLFFLFVILMVIPVQVTIVPNYMVLADFRLLNSYAALILPAVFFPLGTFILRQSFVSIPDTILDAAQIDGCTAVGMLLRIAVPMNWSGVICVIFLTFLDAWNMVEQPIAYLSDFDKYPLSVALAYAPPDNFGIYLTCCVLVLLPPLFLFLFFSEDLVDGIAIAEVK